MASFFFFFLFLFTSACSFPRLLFSKLVMLLVGPLGKLITQLGLLRKLSMLEILSVISPVNKPAITEKYLAMASFFFFFLFLFTSSLLLSSASVLKVGDAVGWSIGKIDYSTWASKKTFHVGDTLLFEYNNTYHNVMEVMKADYGGCSTKSPMKTYATGKDSVAISSPGDHYYLCGFPGHCQAGQKLKITALAKGSSAAPSPMPSMAPTSPGASPGSPSMSPPGSGGAGANGSSPSAAPNANDAAVSCKGLGLGAMVAVAVGLVVMFN